MSGFLIFFLKLEFNTFASNILVDHMKAADMEVIRGAESSHSYSLLNRTLIQNGKIGGKRKVKKIRKKGYHAYNVDNNDDEDADSYEKIITKTKIVVHKARKSKKPKDGYSSSNEEYEEYEDEENESENGMHAIGVYSLYISNDLTVKHRLPKPSTCITWNGNKVKTFDGLVYTHNLRCSHTLIKDKIDGTFSIVLRACSSATAEACYAIEIMMSNTKYIIENLSKFELAP